MKIISKEFLIDNNNIKDYNKYIIALDTTEVK